MEKYPSSPAHTPLGLLEGFFSIFNKQFSQIRFNCYYELALEVVRKYELHLGWRLRGKSNSKSVFTLLQVQTLLSLEEVKNLYGNRIRGFMSV